MIERLTDAFNTVKEQLFGCRHPYPVARLELVPGYEFARYFWECEECGAEWDE